MRSGQAHRPPLDSGHLRSILIRHFRSTLFAVLAVLILGAGISTAQAGLSCDDHYLTGGPLFGWRMTMIYFNENVKEFPSEPVKFRESSFDNGDLPGYAGKFYVSPTSPVADEQAKTKMLPEVTIQILRKHLFHTRRYRNPMMNFWSVTDRYAVTIRMTAPIEIGIDAPDDIMRPTETIEIDTFCSEGRSEPAAN